MTPRQILDSFSETLMQDQRILNAQERSLLAMLLQHATAANGHNPETQQAVRSVIASAVGETVAQRAFAVLGSSIVEKILENTTGTSALAAFQNGEIFAGDPQPPRGTQTPGPGVKAPPKPTHAPMRGPSPPSPADPSSPSPSPSPVDPQPPRATPPPKHQPLPHGPMGGPAPSPDPQPPRGTADKTVVAETAVEVAEHPALLPARCVVLDEFLAPQELERITAYAMEHETDFAASEVVSPEVEGGVVNYEHRRSRVLMDLGEQQELILRRIKSVLPQVLDQLGMEEFTITDVEAQMTASNDGDYFHFHSDNGSAPVSSRNLTFVYFFHREPMQFEGGELRIHDAQREQGTYVSQGSYQTIVPRQNQIVFFPCELMHEITPVKCPSGLFADSRFTLNGWLRR